MAEDSRRTTTSPLELLACVARADEQVTLEEALAIRGFMGSARLSEEQALRVERLLDIEQPVDVQEVVRRLAAGASPWVLTETVRDAYVIAASDGEVEASEIHAVDVLFEALGLAEDRRAWLHRWGRKAAQQQLRGMDYMAAGLEEARADAGGLGSTPAGDPDGEGES